MFIAKSTFNSMIEPVFPKFHIADHIKIEETEYVNDELVPVIQFNISVSKEALEDHKIFWLNYFKKLADSRLYYDMPTPDRQVKDQIVRALSEEFSSYIWKRIMNDNAT